MVNRLECSIYFDDPLYTQGLHAAVEFQLVGSNHTRHNGNIGQVPSVAASS